MPAERAYLRAVMADRNGKTVWSGEYACSICDMRFRADAADAEKLSREYEAHKEQRHAATGEREESGGSDVRDAAEAGGPTK
jgi:hypothetical protein